MPDKSMSKNLWWVTRPTRDLHDLKDSLRRFAEIAEESVGALTGISTRDLRPKILQRHPTSDGTEERVAVDAHGRHGYVRGGCGMTVNV